MDDLTSKSITEENNSTLPPVRVFVGDLSYFCNEENLEILFGSYGTVRKVDIRRGEETHGSLMHGFVEMEVLSDAITAANALDGIKFMGRKMRVVVGGNNPRQGGRSLRNNWVQIQVSFVTRRMDILVNEDLLDKIFSAYGEIMDVTIKKHVIDNSRKNQSGYGFVFYPSYDQAMNAIHNTKKLTLNGITYDCNLTHRSEDQLKKHIEHSSSSSPPPPPPPPPPLLFPHSAPAPPLVSAVDSGVSRGGARAPSGHSNAVLIASPSAGYALSPSNHFQPFVPNAPNMSVGMSPQSNSVSYQGYGSTPPQYIRGMHSVHPAYSAPMMDYPRPSYAVDAGNIPMSYSPYSPQPVLHQPVGPRVFSSPIDYSRHMPLGSTPSHPLSYQPAYIHDHQTMPMALSPIVNPRSNFNIGYGGVGQMRAPLHRMARGAQQRAQQAIDQNYSCPSPAPQPSRQHVERRPPHGSSRMGSSSHEHGT